MSDPQRILVVGATGLIGSEVIELAVGREDVSLVALARNEIPLPEGARMEVMLAEPDGWPQAVATIAPEVVICALGTTWKKSGRDEDAFRAVDHDLVMIVAEAAKAAGAGHFVLVSSAGASRMSQQFYLRTKGEVEEAVGKLKFRRLDILRPGLLRGKRENDRRLGERLGILASPLGNLLLQGDKKQFRAIDASVVAIGALQAAREKAGGRFVHDNDGIARLVSRFERF